MRALPCRPSLWSSTGLMPHVRQDVRRILFCGCHLERYGAWSTLLHLVIQQCEAEDGMRRFINRYDVAGALLVLTLTLLGRPLWAKFHGRASIPTGDDSATSTQWLFDPAATMPLPTITHTGSFEYPPDATHPRPFTDVTVAGAWVVAAAGPGVIRFERATRKYAGEWEPSSSGLAQDRVAPQFASVYSDHGRIWAYDYGHQTLIALNPDHFADPVENRLRLASNLVQPTKTSGGVIAATTDPSSLKFFAPDTAESGPLQTLRLIRSVDARVYPQAHQGIAVHVNRTSLAHDAGQRRTALAYVFVNRIQIFDRDGVLEHSIAGPDEVPLIFSAVHREVQGKAPLGFRMTAHTRMAYVDIATAGDRVVGLFSGRTARAGAADWNAADQLHVFSWEGRLLGRWRLDTAITKLDFDETGTVMYGVTASPTPQLVQFDVTKIRYPVASD